MEGLWLSYLSGRSSERRTMVADVSSYNVVLKALGRRKFFAFMESVLSEMRSKGLKMDNETFFILRIVSLKVNASRKLYVCLGNWKSLGWSMKGKV
ncbi:putative tetratricopeptide-like helical domain superfamily [Helianthus annuus]|uniref:Tetratricopeptide-like helical domain superfamily n=1 Tax=Helianthus annuus TaxID=4232 RepID=A0A9K3HYG6_HELAN|nr:putative tetratricopeptide-like helical domain superfamily [Helianthus annuus]